MLKGNIYLCKTILAKIHKAFSDALKVGDHTLHVTPSIGVEIYPLNDEPADQILHHATHNHSSAYSSTLAAGLFIFQDVFDARFFEYQARQMAAAIETAAANLKPARMAAMEIPHRIYKGNVVRLATANDASPLASLNRTVGSAPAVAASAVSTYPS